MEIAVDGRVHSVETFGAVDGPGIRYIVFLQGCPLKCLYCHNPDSWDRCGGTVMTSQEVVENISQYKNFIRRGGVTLSGGEPLLQPEFVEDILKRCRRMGYHTAVDTAGSVPLTVSRPVIDAADMLLLDIKAFSPALSTRLTGADGKNALDTLDYCEFTGKSVWIRHVLLPGYTLDTKLLEELADYLKDFSCVKKVELLPFHKLGEFKWKELNIPYELEDTQPPTPEQTRAAAEIFRAKGLHL